MRLRHAIADGFAATKLHFLAIANGVPVGVGQAHASAKCEVLFNLYQQSCVCQPHTVANGRTEDFCVGASPNRCHGLKRSLYLPLKTEHPAVSRKIHQLDGALLPWLKSNRQPRGNIQPHAACCHSIKAQCAIGFSKVVVRAHLNGPVCRVLHHDGDRTTARIQNMVRAVRRNDFTGSHVFQVIEKGIKQSAGEQSPAWCRPGKWLQLGYQESSQQCRP